jgi:hypothetical protein
VEADEQHAGGGGEAADQESEAVGRVGESDPAQGREVDTDDRKVTPLFAPLADPGGKRDDAEK